MLAPSHVDLVARAQEWCLNDPNEASAQYVKTLLESASTDATAPADNSALAELERLFPENMRIGFGTAGCKLQNRCQHYFCSTLLVCLILHAVSNKICLFLCLFPTIIQCGPK